jgi:hypothetical protein
MSAPPHAPEQRKTRRGRAPGDAPIVSRRPWAGFSGHDSPRPQALAICPSARCSGLWRLIAHCSARLSSLDNLYCLRTHHSLAEQCAIKRQSPLQRELDLIPPVFDGDDLGARVERIAALAAVRRAHEAEMQALWKSGALDHLYGPYKPHGVMLKPPPRTYVEAPVNKPKNRGRQAGWRAV